MSKFATMAALATLVAAPAVAEGEWSSNITLTTDYVWRGISQANEDPAIQGGFDYVQGGFYAGTWASVVDFDAGPDQEDVNLEVDFYAGFSNALTEVLSYDVGVIYYAYPDADAADLDFVEVYGGLSFEAENGFGVGGYVYIDPDNENIYTEGTVGFTVLEDAANDTTVTVDASLGHYSIDSGEDYLNWSVGTTLGMFGFEFDLRYWDTDVDGAVSIAEDRFVLSISR